MDRRTLLFVTIASLAIGLVGQRIYAQDRSGHPLIKGVTDAKVTLQQGLTAAAQQGRPISAKFEVEGRGVPAFGLHGKGWEVL
jgi:hypothetical protein